MPPKTLTGQDLTLEWTKKFYQDDENHVVEEELFSLPKKIVWKILPENSKRSLFNVITLHDWLFNLKKSHSLRNAKQNIASLLCLKAIFSQLDETQVAEIKLFFTRNSERDWQDEILNVSMNILVEFSYLELDFPHNRFNHDDFETRFRTQYQIDNVALQAYLLCGSSFTQLNSKHHKNTVMDAGLIGEVLDPQHNTTGAVISVADGYGGHVDPDEDKMIAFASKTANLMFARLFASFTDPDLLVASLLNLIAIISNEIRTTAKGSTASFVGVRVFKQVNDLRVIGFSLGDCLLASYSPSKNRVETLGVGYATKMGPPELVQYNQNDIRPIDFSISLDSIIIAMTDGAYGDQDWIHKIQEKGFKTYTVDNDKFKQTFFSDPNQPLTTCKQLFKSMKHQLKQSWVEKASTVSEQFPKMGDDVTLGLFQFKPGVEDTTISSTSTNSTSATNTTSVSSSNSAEMTLNTDKLSPRK